MSAPVADGGNWWAAGGERGAGVSRDAEGVLRALTFVGYGAIGTAFLVGILTASIEWLLAGINMLVLAFITTRIARRLAAWDGDDRTATLVVAGLGLKYLGCLLRILLTSVFYSGVADASEYDAWGRILAPHYRVLNFSDDVGALSGTGFMRSLTGVVYALTGESKPGGYVIFGWLAFIGALLLWRAFRRTVPEGDSSRYAYLLFFLPSMIYWPSALGKDAWSLFCLGLISYGVARVMSRGWVLGLPIAGAGLVGVGLLRPHIALTAFIGMVLAAGVGRTRSASLGAPLARIVVFGLLFVVGTVLLGRTSAFFGVASLNQETVAQTLEDAQGRTAEAGSNFTPVDVTSNPANFPLAVVTVLFRPFPFEVTNVQSVLSAGEGVFLIWLTWRSRRRLRNLWRQMRDAPYVAYSVGIVLSFTYAFSAFSNFGILARQRVQVLPFFLVLLCIPERAPKVDPAEIGDGGPAGAAPEDPYPSGPAADDPYASYRTEDTRRDDPYAAFREATPRRPGPYDG
ncbi:MAG: hypothetical protein ACKO2C_02290 [Actinomycetes bacterium]